MWLDSSSIDWLDEGLRPLVAKTDFANDDGWVVEDEPELLDRYVAAGPFRFLINGWMFRWCGNKDVAAAAWFNAEK